MRNLERFRQSSILSKKPTALFPPKPSIIRHITYAIIIIEGFGGKRAVGILRKIELCPKRFKFRMQFCIGVLNNVLQVFSLKFASFLRYYVCEKHIFPRASSRDLLLNEKQKTPFVSLNDELTIIP